MKKKGILILSVFFLITFLIWCCVRIQEPMQEPLLEETETENEAIVIGFSQLGAESDWRSANTESMLHTFSKENGYTLEAGESDYRDSKIHSAGGGLYCPCTGHGDRLGNRSC